jgi:hypothetical protein
MAMNRATIKKQLQEGLNAVFGLTYKSVDEPWRRYMTVESEGRKAYVEDVMMFGSDVPGVKAEGAPVAYTEGGESYVARYVFETIALAFAITEEAEEDGLYGSIGAKMAKSMARAFKHAKNIKNANILNNGFDSAFPGGDAVQLFSVSHPTVSGNMANKLATDSDLSETSAEDMLILIHDMQDDRGIPCNLSAKTLVIPSALMFTAARLFRSPLRSGTAENDLNAFKELNMLQNAPVVDKNLTDPDAWFIVTDSDDGLKHIVRKAISGKVEGEFETGNLRFRKRERYINGWSNWRGAAGSPGS